MNDVSKHDKKFRSNTKSMKYAEKLYNSKGKGKNGLSEKVWNGELVPVRQGNGNNRRSRGMAKSSSQFSLNKQNAKQMGYKGNYLLLSCFIGMVLYLHINI